MIIAVDIGGTKTLVAAANLDGTILNELRFETPREYPEFLKSLADNIAKVTTKKFEIITVAVPGLLDREAGVVKRLGNLPWVDKPIANDISELFEHADVLIENDANLAGLSEAHELGDLNQKVLYITFSTGIGTGFIENGVLEPSLLDAEGGYVLVGGEIWQSIASGKAIVKEYGKRASDIEDPVIWDEIAKDMTVGIIDIVAIFQPKTVIIGGGVGSHFAKFGAFLQQHVSQQIPKMVNVPTIVGAKRAEEAVIYGCIILAKQELAHTG
jgi:predicted NBD/HSP70 family sugar kinase